MRIFPQKMHAIRLQMAKHPLNYFRLLYNVQKRHKLLHSACYYATSDDVDTFTNDLVERFKAKQNNVGDTSLRHVSNGSINKDVTNMSIDDINDLLTYLLSKNKDNQIEELLQDCLRLRKFIGEIGLKKLFRHYSLSGKPDMITVLQNYCSQLDRIIYKRNCAFEHYKAKAQCFKGNCDKGLSLLRKCYEKNQNLRSFYRVIFRELIQDTVMNRSEASLVILKKYVLDFSSTWNDHYPLICFWHICWSSSWFSDQQLADELLNSSTDLQEIIKDRATAFSITILRQEYNEDAVMRLLQTLLKYEMMDEYAKVLQVLFNFKLKNRDIRGCKEIIKNCELLGVNLPATSQGRYIKMLIQGKTSTEQPQTDKPSLKDFKLKF